MDDQKDLAVMLRSRIPIIVIETRDESRIIGMLQSISLTSIGPSYMPLFRWTVTDGLQRLDIDLAPQTVNSAPADVLKHMRAVEKPGIYVLLDFHPFLEDPIHVRLIKDICIRYQEIPRQIVLIGHAVKLPAELDSFSARFDISFPSETERRNIVKKVADEWVSENSGRRVKADAKAHEMLIRNLAGLTYSDTERLARNAIFADGAISSSDLAEVMQAKYELLNRGGSLQFEYDTARFNDLGGMERLKDWLSKRKSVFTGGADVAHLDAPKGIVLLGVQGCGKSLAAKTTAGIFGVPLLRLDFGAIYDKYHGETERKLRESLHTADIMAPCVLWIDEIEKGIAGRGGETGTTQRVLGTFLTWMAEKQSQVFVVATANDIEALPPELVRKGRFDEIFFVDLPDPGIRAEILRIHLQRRKQEPAIFDVASIVGATDGYSGSEIEQAVVSALYTAHAQNQSLTTAHIIAEVQLTHPLSVVMREQIEGLRQWAGGRTVPVN
ncbi:MAG: AAA family ATPase [Gammaproteobacteria bacterium]|nr:AAA family ATPase [Gammaproteobacteria bacterium]MDH5302992.1 AAA family ATPase [Gammaproteobacteria bacterium]MDH5321261.1 AAA family ATPase [Gammaproteobacteria bacterium]